MVRLPNQNPPGKQFELRVAASDLEFDALLASMTLPETRPRLPGFLHLFSQRRFILDDQDRDIDGHSAEEARFRGFKMRVTNHHRHHFSVEPGVELAKAGQNREIVLLKLRMQLGIQAASEVMTEPYFSKEEKSAGGIPMYYLVHNPLHPSDMGSAVIDLEHYLDEKPRGIIDELTLVESAFRHRKIRERARPNVTVELAS